VEYIKLGMQFIEYSSCIRFVPADEDEENYLFVLPSTSGCSSKVGYQPGERTVKLKPGSLDTGCFKLGTIQHELLHTLGFHHQLMRLCSCFDERAPSFGLSFVWKMQSYKIWVKLVACHFLIINFLDTFLDVYIYLFV